MSHEEYDHNNDTKDKETEDEKSDVRKSYKKTLMMIMRLNLDIKIIKTRY